MSIERSNERIYFMAPINASATQYKIQKFIDEHGQISVRQIWRIAGSNAGQYYPQKDIDIDAYGLTSLNGAFQGNSGRRLFFQLPTIEKFKTDETETSEDENSEEEVEAEVEETEEFEVNLANAGNTESDLTITTELIDEE